ncbi:Receptor-type guanylate cyclase gcy [Seminavis robusta]|uniref:Receptor-type guanylate cyclase gcy n=1 Tax=Seminavis robusta TaxID=568900 RepID=A0A9N8E5B8_9STRA|nr:Receptor-type guanylate cyclase gcy [Seminavis robusta]|eukprot:Sro534_g161750.1 Receptor-type guanylate cyclase gcy (947) ;mRNA; r:11571-15247
MTDYSIMKQSTLSLVDDLSLAAESCEEEKYNDEDEEETSTRTNKNNETSGNVHKSASTEAFLGAGDIIWKSLMVLLLSLIGLAAGFAFIYGLVARDLVVTDKYYEYAEHIVRQSQAKARQTHDEMAPLNLHLTSSALAASSNVSWPYVTDPNFVEIAESFTAHWAAHQQQLIALAPLVVEQQEAWEDYSVDNQAWASTRHDDDKEVTTSRRRRLHSDHEDANSTIPTRIFTRDLEYDPDHKKEYRRVEKGPGPFLPLWQMFPIPSEFSTPQDRDLSPVNYNALSHPRIARAVQAVQDHGAAILTEPFHLFELFGIHWQYTARQYGNETSQEHLEPHSVIVSPVYQDFDTSAQNRTLVAVLLQVVPWKTFFENLLPTGDNGIQLVLTPHSTICGEPFSFQLNGKEAVFLGYGDQHDSEQDFFDIAAPFSPFVSSTATYNATTSNHTDDAGYCHYELHIYPSPEFYKNYHSDIPRIFAASQVAIFIFVCCVLQLYNCFAMRQEKRIQAVVKRSNAIVERFFPSDVRNRLLEDNDANEDNNNNNANNTTAAAKVSILPKKKDNADSNNNNSNVKENNKVQLNLNRDLNAVAFQGKPIATLFPQCTVLFAQIVGFTEWSLEHSPEDVFRLLETLYQEFDHLARHRNVFKVETIGDQYLAVAGLPEPQPDHAYIMARFARSCMLKMTEVMAALQPRLGPETSNLKLKIGLHSGPVTAGVLRGQKASHFQLFGDTVNTASRMQSTSTIGRIQVSVETAHLLDQGGRTRAKSWLTPRDDVVEAKGKGVLQTFWLASITNSNDGSSKAKSTSSSNGDAQSDMQSQAFALDNSKHCSPGMSQRQQCDDRLLENESSARDFQSSELLPPPKAPQMPTVPAASSPPVVTPPSILHSPALGTNTAALPSPFQPFPTERVSSSPDLFSLAKPKSPAISRNNSNIDLHLLERNCANNTAA